MTWDFDINDYTEPAEYPFWDRWDVATQDSDEPEPEFWAYTTQSKEQA